ncbi:hypothetical protein [Actinoplanes solisilvae]|uniref:hypothetical protein n=1 Tax=Actinoplanes solisilvae TaxID=2486853 RepID=UPI000FDAA2B3|nr:hypothetical protein [Actinoplanes solisilvae]
MALRSLTTAQRTALDDGIQLVRQAIGAFALDRVRVYSASEQVPCSHGFYSPLSGDVAAHADILLNRFRLLGTPLHEAAHRVTHRGSGRWLPSRDYADRCRGFE